MLGFAVAGGSSGGSVEAPRTVSGMATVRGNVGCDRVKPPCVALAAALRGAATMEVTQRAYEDYVAEIDAAMRRTVWCHTPNAHTYYRSGSGRVVVATPYRLVDVWRQHRAPIEQDFTLR